MYLQNFRRYWKEQLTHAAVGAVAGFLLVSGNPLGRHGHSGPCNRATGP